MSKNEAIEIWKDATNVVDDVLDIYLNKAEKAGGKDCGAYRLIMDIKKQFEIEFDYRIRP